MGKTKIERLGENAEIMVHQMRQGGDSLRTIADEVSEIFGTNVSHEAVKSYLDKNSNKSLERMGSRNAQELEKRKQEKVIEVADQLEKINKKLNKAIDNLEEEERSDIGLLINLSKEIRNQLKMHKEYLEEVNPSKTEINQTNVEINQTEIQMKFNEYLRDLEDEGAIQIVKPEKL